MRRRSTRHLAATPLAKAGHYCEQLVIDEGFPAGADKVTAAKYRLEQSDEALFTCRPCCAADALLRHERGRCVQVLHEQLLLRRKPARAEAERGTYDPGYGFYTLGKLQILKLRDDYRQQEGPNFSMQKFNDQLLALVSRRSACCARWLLLKDQKTWDEELPHRLRPSKACGEHRGLQRSALLPNRVVFSAWPAGP